MASGYIKNFKNHAVMIPRFAGVDTGLTGITFGGKPWPARFKSSNSLRPVVAE